MKIKIKKKRKKFKTKRPEHRHNILQSLSHPNIVKLLHHFEDQIKICLVLELCEKKSLTVLLKQHGQVSLFMKMLTNLYKVEHFEVMVII